MKINVDAGHGSQTAGKRTPPMPINIDVDGNGTVDLKKGEQYREHYANVGVSSYLLQELKRCGSDTFQTGFDDTDASDDADIALLDRQKAIVKANCDYSISIHFNAYGDGKSFNSANGIGIYIHDKNIGQSEKIAKVVLNRLAEGTKQKNRGITKQGLAMCNCNNLNVKAAILVELAFMTNEEESIKMMANETYWKECAQEICRGICEYTGIKYIPKGTAPETTITPKSAPEDILWAKKKLNQVLPITPGLIPLDENGIYDSMTRLAVLLYWNKLGWGKDMADDGTRIGKATRTALSEGRKK